MATMKPLVTDLVSTLNHVPSNFIRPIDDRPNLLSKLIYQMRDLGFSQYTFSSRAPLELEDVAEYSRQLRRLALRLLEAISERLGLEKDYINKALGKHGQHMAINYYPPCPEPDLTYGLPAHADPNVITILLQNDVAGLQVLKDGKWVTINPVPNTFIVNIVDQIQVISNDRYKSVLHRALVNSEKERMSIPTFYCPSPDAIIRPAPQLIDKDHTVQYKEFEYNEYYNKFWNRGLSKETCVNMFKV